MSRVAKVPVIIPSGVDVRVEGQSVAVKGSKGSLKHVVHSAVEVLLDNSAMRVVPRVSDSQASALAGTTRALLSNMVTGVSQGFEKKLELVGVGYRVQMKAQVLSLALGYSHPIDFPVPEGVVIETPSNTQIIVRGIDKQRVGQVAATIRNFRPPEPYKGKGVRYADETIVRKVAKKK
uniref:Large ribosomal subunit protein uL6 n=1 Tax=Candidatus Kentrum sp. FM TaxID=2126340 RepID=A0A450S1T4_9GAMM|nr:MAG: large subunit ribosomal protein L6 [Candidatus Kentron sp. FM]VFJ45596.1 MAG: large subunit ribosomal protein L6 [Candidatus Kentron sp. FM]VFK06945.1 MAG: large subunit ribosomal protein L6 [Candidatus Kentron sp. FM]